MAYVIAEPCIGTKDSACVDVCPVDCIHPRKDEPQFGDRHLRPRRPPGKMAKLYAGQRRLVCQEIAQLSQ